MGVNVDRTGTFRCKLLEHGVSKTKEKGYPQFVGRVSLTQFYEEKGGEDGKGEWFDISDWGMETNIYVCLYGVKKGEGSPSRTLGYDQVMKVFDWDGVSLAQLASADLVGAEFQVRVTENTYEGAKTPFQVSWIDEYDADPVYTLRKLDADELKDLDAQFSNITVSASQAKSAKKGKPAPPKAASKKTTKSKSSVKPKDPTNMSKEEKKAAMKAKSDRIKQEAAKQKQAAKANAAKKNMAPPIPDDEPEITHSDGLPLPEPTEAITKVQAWEKIFEMRDPTIDDDTIKELWDTAIEEVAGEGTTAKDITPDKTTPSEQWCQVKDIVLADCAKF